MVWSGRKYVILAAAVLLVADSGQPSYLLLTHFIAEYGCARTQCGDI